MTIVNILVDHRGQPLRGCDEVPEVISHLKIASVVCQTSSKSALNHHWCWLNPIKL